jgi:hypothetical protein
MLNLDHLELPPEFLDWNRPDDIAAWIEKLILEAERQMPGIQRGPERMTAVVETVISTVEVPDVAASLPPGVSVIGRREIARMLCQMVYSTLARNLPTNLRTPKG